MRTAASWRRWRETAPTASMPGTIAAFAAQPVPCGFDAVSYTHLAIQAGLGLQGFGVDAVGSLRQADLAVQKMCIRDSCSPEVAE